MPFPEKDYYKIIMELENEEYNNSNSNFGNNNNAANIAVTGIFGNTHYDNNTGISLFGLNQSNNVAENTEGIGLFGYSNNAGKSIFEYNANKTGTSLFGNTSANLFGNNSTSLFGTLA